jgi:hypothetical protein
MRRSTRWWSIKQGASAHQRLNDDPDMTYSFAIETAPFNFLHKDSRVETPIFRRDNGRFFVQTFISSNKGRIFAEGPNRNIFAWIPQASAMHAIVHLTRRVKANLVAPVCLHPTGELNMLITRFSLS